MGSAIREVGKGGCGGTCFRAILGAVWHFEHV